jgi:hypothetical protein
MDRVKPHEAYGTDNPVIREGEVWFLYLMGELQLYTCPLALKNAKARDRDLPAG